MAAIKRTLDPHNIMNPGKVIDVSRHWRVTVSERVRTAVTPYAVTKDKIYFHCIWNQSSLSDIKLLWSLYKQVDRFINYKKYFYWDFFLRLSIVADLVFKLQSHLYCKDVSWSLKLLIVCVLYKTCTCMYDLKVCVACVCECFAALSWVIFGLYEIVKSLLVWRVLILPVTPSSQLWPPSLSASSPAWISTSWEWWPATHTELLLSHDWLTSDVTHTVTSDRCCFYTTDYLSCDMSCDWCAKWQVLFSHHTPFVTWHVMWLTWSYHVTSSVFMYTGCFHYKLL